MNKVLIKDGKAILYDDRWVTIGGEDEDGSGQHVLIKENGTIVAGFGKGKNVKNAFSETNKESGAKHSAGGAKPEAKPEAPKEKKSLATPEALLKSNKNYKAWAESEVERLRKERDQKYRDAYTEEEGVKIVEKYDKEINELKESLKRTDENIRKHTKAVEEKTSTLKEEEEANRKAKAEIFRQAAEESKRKQAEKDRKDKIEARKSLKRAEAGLAEAKAKGDGKSQSFWEATRDRAENTLGKSSDPERQIKLLEKERDRKYDEAETEKEKTKVFNAYKRKIDAIRSLGRKSASDSKIVVIADGKVKIGE